MRKLERDTLYQAMFEPPSQQQIHMFSEDGFLVVDDFVDPDLAAAVAERFERLFRGEFETTVPPDEWRWCEGRDPVDVTRMIWNGWKCDRTVARLALHEKVGCWCARLAGWQGARLNQDGCLWKPPGAGGLAFHQDGNYIQWVDPAEEISCWIALDDVDSESGTLEYARGTHRWGAGERPTDFHDPSDHQALLHRTAEKLGRVPEIVPVVLRRGGAAFHHSWLWHGSGPNRSARHRRALALHCMPSVARFHPANPAFAQGRFRIFGENRMEESFYPILWSEDDRRSEFISSYLDTGGMSYRSHAWRREDKQK